MLGPHTKQTLTLNSQLSKLTDGKFCCCIFLSIIGGGGRRCLSTNADGAEEAGSEGVLGTIRTAAAPLLSLKKLRLVHCENLSYRDILLLTTYLPSTVDKLHVSSRVVHNCDGHISGTSEG